MPVLYFSLRDRLSRPFLIFPAGRSSLYAIWRKKIHCRKEELHRRTGSPPSCSGLKCQLLICCLWNIFPRNYPIRFWLKNSRLQCIKHTKKCRNCSFRNNVKSSFYMSELKTWVTGWAMLSALLDPTQGCLAGCERLIKVWRARQQQVQVSYSHLLRWC